MASPVTDKTFKTKVLESEKPVIVDIWAAWCGPCVAMAPKFDELSKQTPEVSFYKYDCEKHEEYADKYNVKSIPAFFLFHKGKKVDEAIGSDTEGLVKLVEKAKTL